jgi:purine-cytosine permease-like protein
MGWWPVKLCILLNLVVLLGYAMIDAVIAGQILSAVSPNGSLTVEVGIIITAILTFMVTTFGIKIFHHLERSVIPSTFHTVSANNPRWAWLPQSIVLIILLGTEGPRFNLSSPSNGSPTTIIGNRLSFLGVCISSAITYAPCAADFLVYSSPQITTRWKVFTAAFAGLNVSFLLTYTLGTGLASGLSNDPTWATAGTGTGALIVAGYDDLGKFGKLCSILVALGMISNMVPQVYSAGIDMQILGRYPALVPRFIWNTFGVVVFTVCGLAGRSNLSQIFTNFLALMGYWISIWISITLEETYIFRRRRNPRFEWKEWDKKEKLPIGLAALMAFVVGWAGAVVSMAQYFYVGPVARLVGVDGADLGNYVGVAAAALVFPPLRYWELKRFGR